MQHSVIIAISGSSGVGKTTLSHLFMVVLGNDRCLCISGDDLHRWERSDPMWEKYTHLDPLANDLELAHRHLLSLKSGCSITRRHYNHDTGKFDTGVFISPKPYIVVEGLHTMYSSEDRSLSDIKIFVDTDESLKTEWKIRRDTKRRGYTKDQVLKTMIRRKTDEAKHILPQRDHADIIVKFTKSRDSRVNLDYVCITDKGKELMQTVVDAYESMTDFTEVCKWLSLEPSLVQGKGGNVSCKTQDGIIITASGSKMGDITFNHGYSVCKKQIIKSFVNEQEYTSSIEASIILGECRPSMESGFHMKLKHRVVVHTHPIHLNTILCSKESEQIVSTLFRGTDFQFVKYTTPGFEVCNAVDESSSVVFLQNHGLIVGADTAEEAFETTERINNRCKRWIGIHVDSFTDENDCDVNDYVFPDAAVFPTQLSNVNRYITRMMGEVGLTPLPLSDQEVLKLNNMEAEKHRKKS